MKPTKSQAKRLAVQKPKTLLRKNPKSLPPKAIVDQMTESRPLPIGRTEFQDWSDRIISGALVEHDPSMDEQVFRKNQKIVLANMIVCLGPTESHKPDAHFIHGLRMAAVKQTAHMMGTEIREELKPKLEAVPDEQGGKLLTQPGAYERAQKEAKAHKEMEARAVTERAVI